MVLGYFYHYFYYDYTIRFEGKHRTRLAEEGIALMERVTDTLIVIPNQNVFQLIDEVYLARLTSTPRLRVVTPCGKKCSLFLLSFLS